MASSAEGPTDYRYWDLSTKHISQRDAELLSSSTCLVTYEYDYGWFVVVPQDDVDEVLLEAGDAGMSEAVRRLLRTASERGIRMIRFDRDGDLVAGLEAFDW